MRWRWTSVIFPASTRRCRFSVRFTASRNAATSADRLKFWSALVRNNSWQVAISYFLTGESKSYKSGSPLKDFDPKSGGWGAWELAARYGQLAVDPAVYSLGLADAAKSARKAQAWAVGVNWYLNKNVKLVLDYEDTGFIGGSATGNRNRERALLNRFQISF